MKKFLNVLYLFFIITFPCIGLFSCANLKNANNATSNNESLTSSSKQTTNDKIKIITTIFPIYDITKNLLPNDKYNVSLLLDSSIDIHNFQPTATDIINIANSNLFIYIGGESDKWVDKVLKTSQNKNLNTLNLMEPLAHLVKEEEIVEGMEHEHDSEHNEDLDNEHNEEHDKEHHHEIENDEHIWLSLKNAKELIDVIAEKLISLNENDNNIILKNTATLKSKIDELDKKYLEVVNNAQNKILLFADRFPFRYLVDDYGLTYFAAFSGCSAEAEASFETVAFLSKKIDELDLKHICAMIGSNHNIPETVKNTTKNKNQDFVYFNSMENIVFNDSTNISYIKIMEDNLSSLEKALN